MDRIIAFGKDFWGYSSGRMQRADPLLMGAAIAYNSLFALVPLAIAFVALLTLFDRTVYVLDNVYDALYRTLPAELAAFIVGILEDSFELVSAQRGLIVAVSLLVALWSGSRAVYAVQKALRTVQGIDDERSWFVTRMLGVGVTVAAGIGVLVAYFFLAVGGRVWGEITDDVSRALGLVQMLAVAAAVVLVWLLLWAIYQWGAPEPMPRSGLLSAIVAGLLVLGSLLAVNIVPSGKSAITAFGVVGVFLVWLYYVGIVIVAAPTVVHGISHAARQMDRPPA